MSNTCTTEYILTGDDVVILPLAAVLTEACESSADSLYNIEEVAEAVGFRMKETDHVRGKWSNVRILNAMCCPVLSFIEEAANRPTEAMDRLLGQSVFATGIDKVFCRVSDWDLNYHYTNDEEGQVFPESYAFYCKEERHIGFCNSREEALEWCRGQYPEESFEMEDFKFVEVKR